MKATLQRGKETATVYEIPAQPYPVRIYFARTEQEYHKAHSVLIGGHDNIEMFGGRTVSVSFRGDGFLRILFYVRHKKYLPHEALHVCLLVFRGSCKTPTPQRLTACGRDAHVTRGFCKSLG